MSLINRRKLEIPMEELTGIGKIFGRHAQVDMDNIPKKHEALIKSTGELVMSSVKAYGVVASLPIEQLYDHSVALSGDITFQSGILPRVLKDSKEACIYVLALQGYETLEENAASMMAAYYVDCWGTAVLSAVARYAKDQISKEMEAQGLYITSSWSPGQHDLPIDNQKEVFNLLCPDDIGVYLKESLMMHPKKSETGICGIGETIPTEDLIPCDYCRLQKTCPSAHIGCSD